ncbi:MAG: hypothetical protein ACRDD8_02865 [Bacteroidales bacterium]
MATSNFSSGNRTIFVSNYDFDCENIPEFDSKTNVLDTDFIFHEVYIESGYYEGAKIDYRAKDAGDVFNEQLGYSFCNGKDSVDDVIEAIGRYFGKLFEYVSEDEATIMLIDSMIGVIEQHGGKSPEDFDEDEYNELQAAFENTIEKMIEKATEKEEQKVNEYLDELRDSYGYSEYNRIGSASNGETFYETNKVSKRHKIADMIESALSDEEHSDVNAFIYANYWEFDEIDEAVLSDEYINNLFSEFQANN